jgi:BirA family biotin operon repressor/biotin-[acetyl-CoA-carboxylase] ligase
LTCLRFGQKIHYHTVATSTNVLAKSLAGEGAPEGTVVVADSQSGGRGRMGRTWISPPDVNLYCSLILRPAVPSIRVPQLTLLVAVAIHQALRDLTPELTPMIKWPNDIVVNGKKLCGVLCEMQSEPDLTHFVVVGIGMNVNQREIPLELQPIATSLLLESGRESSRPALLAAIMNHFERLYDQWLLEDDLAFILPYINNYALLQSKKVSIDQRSQQLTGTVVGIARGGELQLQSEDGTIMLISSGEANLRKDNS